MSRMSESDMRRRKKAAHAARWRALTPAQRLSRAAAVTADGLKLRAAGLASLGLTRRAKPQ